MRTGFLVLAVFAMALVAASVAYAQDFSSPAVGLGDRTYDATRPTSALSDETWVKCGQQCYQRGYAPPLMQAPRKNWSAILAGYLWATSITGTSYANGEETDIDVPFDDLSDKLDGAFMGFGEFRYCRWSFYVDGSFVALKESETGPRGVVTLENELEQTTIDLGIGFAVLDCTKGTARWGCCCYPRKMTLDALIGARYWNLEQELSLAASTGQRVSRSVSDDWWDPYIGARFRWQFAKRWGLALYGDVGGFGLGDDTSELTWKVQAFVHFYVTRNFFVGVGYRALGVDRVTGSGAAKNGIDATYHGPGIGIGFSF